jgi:type VI protein secretion system component VasK
MEQNDTDIPLDDEVHTAPAAKPKTLTVVGALVGASAMLSCVLSYGVGGALVAAEFVKPFQDHRSRLIGAGAIFVGVMALTGTLALVLRRASGKELSEIDEMAHAQDDADRGEDLLAIRGTRDNKPNDKNFAKAA